MLTRSATLIVAGLICLASVPASQAAVLSFEPFADSEVLSTQLRDSLGVTFSNAVVLTAGVGLNELEFPPRSGVNIVADDLGPLSITFADAVLAIDAYFTYTQQITLEAFDRSDVVAGTIVSSPACLSNLALSGPSGCSPNTRLTLTASRAFTRLVVTGDPAGGSFAMDDLSFTAAVPEPASGIAVALVVFIAFLLIRTKRLSPCCRAVLPFAALLCTRADAAQSVDWIRAAPAQVTAGQQTRVTITAQIGSDATLLTNSITLVQYDQFDRPVRTLGRMVDDGTNGDALLADGIFTMQITVDEPAAATLIYKVSVAYRGLLRRVISAPAQVVVQAVQTPSQMLSALGTELQAGNIDAASKRFTASEINASVLRGLTSTRRAELATAFRTARFNRSLGSVEIYNVTFAIPPAGPVELEIMLQRTTAGEWVIIGW